MHDRTGERPAGAATGDRRWCTGGGPMTAGYRWLVVLLAAPLLAAPGFEEVDKAQEKEELILKLTSDINKVDFSVEETKDLIKRNPDAPYLADLYFRLAELYVERSRYVYARLMEQRPEGEVVLEGEKALEVQISKNLAIETYDKILRDYPEFENNDQVRFYRGHEFRELGEFEKMIEGYNELIAKHPRSDWAIEARLILGDYHFDKGEIEAAQKYYEEVLALPESHLHDMSRYKLGWIRINQEKFKEALQLFEGAVTSERKAKHGAIGDAKSLDVKREALMASVWPFSEVKKAHQAPAYFRGLAETKTLYLAVLKKLADRYFIKTEYPNAALLYRKIVPLSANVEENVEFVQRIYESVRNMSKKNPQRYANAAGDVTAIVKTVARFQNHWRYTEEDKTKLRHDLEVRARDLATQLHRNAQKKKDPKESLVAAEAYRQYLSLFVDANDHAAIEINRASALNEGNDYLGAAAQYERIAERLEDGPERREMIYAAIAGYFRALDEDTVYRQAHPTKPGMLNKLQLLRGREGLKQLGAYYVKTWPKDKNVPSVKFNIASMYFQQAEYEKATELYVAFVDEYPDHKDTGIAGNLALDALNQLDDYEALAKQAQAFAQNEKIKDSAFRANAAKIAEAARKRRVEMTVIATADQDFSETMLGEWEKHKDTAEGEDFLYTAFVKYKNENNIAGVFDFGGRMIGAYPKSKRLTDVMGTMGAFAVRAADFERAAFMFEEYHRRFPEEPNAKDVLASAGNIRFLLGEYDKAAESFRILRKDGNDQQRMLAHQKLIEVYTESRNWKGLALVAQTALTDNRGWLGAAFHLGLAYLEQGQTDAARAELARAAEMTAVSDFDKEAGGRLNFELGRLLHLQYDGIKFTDVASSQKVLGMKMQYLEAVEQMYVASISAGQGEWAIASLYSVARAYAGFGEFIMGAPVPGGMSQAEQVEYEQILTGEAEQYNERAKQTVKACKDKAIELKVFNAYATACLAESLAAVDVETPRDRTRVRGDDAYQREMAELRAKLVKKPESIALMTDLARRAIQVGDYHLAKLTLQKAAEANPREPRVQNLLGVADWSLGYYQDAYAAFAKALKKKSAEAAANLGSLYYTFGYSDQADQVFNRTDLGILNTSSADVHPAVRGVLEESGRK